MTQFKIKLLTSILKTQQDIGVSNFLETPISEFYSQLSEVKMESSIKNQQNTFCYTFDEKLSIHKNAQKELSFSMLKNVWLNDGITENPFVKEIHPGSLILLIDKYDNEYFFIVKNINYKIGSDNITYEVSCQDLFTYQTIRQNSGYTIENDHTSADFIGAKTIDWWVKMKIAKECSIAYKYIPLFEGILQDSNNNIHTFSTEDDKQSLIRRLKNDKITIKKIIKPFYLKEDYPEYYETFPFSVSGGNASSALIELGEQIGLSLNVCESNVKTIDNKRTNQFVQYFWFEPAKKENNSGLKYSPKTNINNFNFSYSGDSLTTVLNVEPTEINEELITFLPSTPSFFLSLFDSLEWKNKNNKYFSGYFSSICKESVYRSKISLVSDFYIKDVDFRKINDEDFIYLQLSTPNSVNGSFKLPFFYQKISTSYKNLDSVIYYRGERYTNKTTTFEFIVVDEKEQEISYNDSYNIIPQKLLGKEVPVFIKIKIDSDSSPDEAYFDKENADLILNFYRDYLDDDIKFAEAADQCPWLENKIIDFSYFLNQNIISREEYSALMDIINNDLRIVNGELLYLSTSYYQALHEKTRELSELINSVDSIGAAFEASVLSPYAEKGVVSDITNFTSAYDLFTSKYKYTSEKNDIINLKDSLTEYANKYFNAQQRFLKNIYNFKKYFNEKVQWENDKLYHHLIKLTIPDIIPPEEGQSSFRRYISFFGNGFEKIDENFPYNKDTLDVQVNIFEEDKRTFCSLINKNKYDQNRSQYYIAEDIPGSIKRCQNVGFSFNNTYLRIVYRILKTKLEEAEETITLNGSSWFLYKEDELYYYYAHAKAEINYSLEYDDYPETIGFYEKSYVEVALNEIISEYLYGLLQTNSLRYFWRNNNTTKTIRDNWFNYGEIQTEISRFSSDYWSSLLGDDKKNEEDLINYYISNFPVTEFQYKARVYSDIPFKWISTWKDGKRIKRKEWTQKYQRVNALGETIEDYINYKKKELMHENLTREIQNPSDYFEEISYPIVTPENENNYYRRVIKNPGWKIGAAAIISSFIPNPMQGVGTGLLLSHVFWRYGSTEWRTEGKNAWDINKNDLLTYCEGYRSGFQTELDETVSIKYTYTTSEDAYENFKALSEERKANDYVFNVKLIEGVEPNLSSINTASAGEYVLEEAKDIYGNNYSFVTKIESKRPIYDSLTLFNNVAFTYANLIDITSSGENGLNIPFADSENITYKDSFLRFLKLEDAINTDDRYAMILQSRKGKELLFTAEGLSAFYGILDNDNPLLSSNVHYLLLGNAMSLDVQRAIKGKDNSLKELLKANGFSSVKVANKNGCEYLLSATYEKENITFFIIKYEDYIREDWSETLNSQLNNSGYLNKSYRFNFYNNYDIYDYDDQKITLLNIPELTNGLFVRSEGYSNYKQATSEFDKNQQYFIFNGQNYKRIYNIEQLMKLPQSFFYQQTTEYDFYSFSPNPSSIESIKLYLHEEEYVMNNGVTTLKTRNTSEYLGKFSLDDINLIDSLNNTLAEAEGKILQANNDTLTIKNYSSSFAVKTVEVEDLSECSNGYLWMKYQKSNLSLLQEKAFQIETQLTEYWTQAFVASKNCEYFLPEFWQQSGSHVNKFASDIILVSYDSEGSIEDVSLSPKFIPEVSLYIENSNILSTAYNFEYESNQQISEETETNTINEYNYVTGKEFKNHSVFKTCFEEILQDDLSNFILTENGKKSFFYVQEGGMKWEDVVSNLCTSNYKYPSLSGAYVMIYRALKSKYNERSFSSYKNKQEEHNLIWSNIYQNFPGIILENTYSNQDVSTPRELYTLAKNYFKDLSHPERSYSLSLIDNSSLIGYNGQEISIGDGILLDVEEYYDEYDDIRKTLSQYLFITDISYTLRSANDIQLTVNSIKYQEKLIQRLVKLIK